MGVDWSIVEERATTLCHNPQVRVDTGAVTVTIYRFCRFNKHSVQSPFKLNKNGEAEIMLSVPDVLAPRKLRFITYVAKDDGRADFWFKNS